ncbi:MAG: hypothetical protein GYA24_13055 [Candidatus Lokiarchaeota archaeon]|nr:hypothetical protein [Candidatus Lokiarchaeota archaeon]
MKRHSHPKTNKQPPVNHHLFLNKRREIFTTFFPGSEGKRSKPFFNSTMAMPLASIDASPNTSPGTSSSMKK